VTLSFLDINSAYQKSKAMEEKVETKIQTAGEITRFFPSEDKSHNSLMKVAPHRKPELSPPNKFESCRKRKLTRKKYISQGECIYLILVLCNLDVRLVCFA
jgi:hypothetical protein